jgi:hypothetical protein
LFAAAVIGATLVPGLGVLPAAASPTARPCSAQFGASASADLVRLSFLDLHPLGVAIGPAADVRVASTRAAMTTGVAGGSRASAQYMAAKLLGKGVPVGPLGPTAAQEAPPTNATGVSTTVLAKDLGVLAAGTGQLNAHATWRRPEGCTTEAGGPAAEASGALLNATILRGRGGRALLNLPSNLGSASSARLTAEHGRLRAIACADTRLVDFSVFAGAAGQVGVRVLTQPRLRVVAGGSKATSSVEYASAVLDVSLPGGPVRRLDGTHQSVEFAAPNSGSLAGAAESARAAGLPLLPGNPLNELLDRLTTVTSAMHAGSTRVTHLTGLAIVRLSIGELRQDVSQTEVRASAAALRVQLLTRTGDRETSVVDLSIGILDAEAKTGYGDGDGYGNGTGSGNGNGTGNGTGNENGGGLPVTGSNVAVLVGGSTVLLVAGRFLMLLARRRFLF